MPSPCTGEASLRGALLLSGALTWFLYLYASMALGTAYNELFLAYVGLLAASLYALAFTLRSVDAGELNVRLADRADRGKLAALMLASGLVTFLVWLAPLAAWALQGKTPDLLDHATTMVTDALDLAHHTHDADRRVPAAQAAPARLPGRVPAARAAGGTFPVIVSQTLFQLEAGVSFTPGEVAGPIGGFLVVAGLAVPLIVATLRHAD